MLDRSDNPSVTAYVDSVDAPDYEGKSLEDVGENTISSIYRAGRIRGAKKGGVPGVAR